MYLSFIEHERIFEVLKIATKKERPEKKKTTHLSIVNKENLR